MVSGWGYRIAGIGGSAILTGLIIRILSTPPAITALSALPLVGRLPTEPISGDKLIIGAIVAMLTVVFACVPLHKPRPRRILDTILLTQERVLIAVFTLATIGYFDYTYRLPRLTLLGMGVVLLLVLPFWFVLIRRPIGNGTWLLVGDDPEQMAQIVSTTNHEFIGYVAPSIFRRISEANELRVDGGSLLADQSDSTRGEVDLPRLGGLANLKEVLIDHDIDTAVLAFSEADRGEFFGVLDTCYDHGVSAKVHRHFADRVLVAGEGVGPLVNVEIEPWDMQDYVVKRAFDVFFSGASLVLLLPVILMITIAIKLEGEGPIFFTQERTFLFGETFNVRKFRTLKHDPEGLVGTTIDEDRHTRLGQFLRTTHLDEIPQLWAILTGRMSVVGPRPAQTAIEDEFEAEATQWRRRWFVKPGLTGLAQINGANSQNPREKIKYDLRYIRNQSFWLDLKILIRQLWMVLEDVATLTDEDSERRADD